MPAGGGDAIDPGSGGGDGGDDGGDDGGGGGVAEALVVAWRPLRAMMEGGATGGGGFMALRGLKQKMNEILLQNT